MERLALQPGERVLDLATGTGEVARRAARAGADGRPRSTAPSRCSRRRARARGAEGLHDRLRPRQRRVPALRRRRVRRASSRTSASSSRPTTRTSPSELARVARPGRRGSASPPGSRTRSSASSTAASPRSRSRGARRTSGAARTTSRTCSARTSSSSSCDGTLWLEAESGEEIWELFSESAPPVIALLRRLDAGAAEEFHQAFVELYEGYRTRAAGSGRRAATCSSSAAANERGRSAPAGADPPRHDESARQRDARRRAAARLPRGGRGRMLRSIARVPERANLVARIRGRGDGPSLALLSHTDVVLADAHEWEREPFGGELVDGEVWGRGALDMKGEVAASAVAIATLAREGWQGSGDLIFVAAADEEVGDGFGLRVARGGASRRGARGLLGQRGRRRPGRARRQGALPLRDRREDELAVPAPRARPQRPRVDAVDRRQRARQGRAARRRGSASSRPSRS